MKTFLILVTLVNGDPMHTRVLDVFSDEFACIDHAREHKGAWNVFALETLGPSGRAQLKCSKIDNLKMLLPKLIKD